MKLKNKYTLLLPKDFYNWALKFIFFPDQSSIYFFFRLRIKCNLYVYYIVSQPISWWLTQGRLVCHAWTFCSSYPHDLWWFSLHVQAAYLLSAHPQIQTSFFQRSVSTEAAAISLLVDGKISEPFKGLSSTDEINKWLLQIVYTIIIIKLSTGSVI